MSPSLLACPTCRAPMATNGLAGSHGRRVDLDHCRACGLSWFEPGSFDALGRDGWVGLLRLLAAAPQDAPPPPGAGEGGCPRCSHALVARVQQTPFGRSLVHACTRGHGHAQRDGALLSSRGLFMPLLQAEREALAAERRPLACLQCGAVMVAGADHCTGCSSPALVVDMARLSIALGLIDDADAGAEASAARPRAAAVEPPLPTWACRRCGVSLDPIRQRRCTACAHPVLVPALADLLPLLTAAEDRLLALARAGVVVPAGPRPAQRSPALEQDRGPRTRQRAVPRRADGRRRPRWGVLAGAGAGALAALWVWLLL